MSAGFNINSPIVQSMYENASQEEKRFMESVGFVNGSAPRIEQSSNGIITTNILEGYSNPFFAPRTNGIPAANNCINPALYLNRYAVKTQEQLAYENNINIISTFKNALKSSISSLRQQDEEDYPWLKEEREKYESFVQSVEEFKKKSEERSKKKLHVKIVKGDEVIVDSDNIRGSKSTEWYRFNANEISSIERRYEILRQQLKLSGEMRFANAVEREADGLTNFSDICKVMSKANCKIMEDDFNKQQSLNHIRRFNNFDAIFNKYKDKSKLTANKMSDEEILRRTSNTIKAFDDSQLKQIAYDTAFSEENKKYARLDENGVLQITAPQFNAEDPPMLLKARLAREADGTNLAAKKLEEAKQIFLRNIHEAVQRSKSNG